MSCLQSPFLALALSLFVVKLNSLFSQLLRFIPLIWFSLSPFLSFSPPPFCVTFCLPHCLSAFPPLLSSPTFLVSPTPSRLIFLFSNLVSCCFSFKDHGSHSSLSFSASPCATLLMPTGCTRCWLRAVPSSHCSYCSFAHLPTDNTLSLPQMKRDSLAPQLHRPDPGKLFPHKTKDNSTEKGQISDSFKLNLAKQRFMWSRVFHLFKSHRTFSAGLDQGPSTAAALS